MGRAVKTIQELINDLQSYWTKQGCAAHLGHDVEVGAGTFNPATFFRALGPEPYCAAYVEPSRRPKDGRYGENPNRLQLFHQFQVIFKPAPHDIQERYLHSLEAMGYDLQEHDIRFVHDDWEQPSLGAWGLGWEVWRDGMEVTQFTYFQAVAGINLNPITVELTYGIERIAMPIQKVDTVWDLHWNETLTYADIYHRNEVEWSRYNFEEADTDLLRTHFLGYEKEANRLVERSLPLPAHDYVMKASHAFNLLDARGVISVTERTGYIQRLRHLSHQVATSYLKTREEMGTPLLKKQWPSLAPRPARVEEPRPLHEPSADLLLEIGSEELPASYLPPAIKWLEKSFEKLFQEEGLAHGELRLLATPRRIALFVQDLDAATSEEEVQRKGPTLALAFDADGFLTRVGKGFCESIGIEEPQITRDELINGHLPQLAIRTHKETDYLYGILQKPARSAAQILSERLPKMLAEIPFPKRMHWNGEGGYYPRPVRWLVALHGEALLPLSLYGIRATRFTHGHRQLDNQTFSLPSASDYLSLLHKHQVMVDPKERKETIQKQAADLARPLGATPLLAPSLLEELIYLTEWPLPALGEFSHTFLSAPEEILTCEMIHHQRTIPLYDSSQKLLPHFLLVADQRTTPGVIEGNQEVITARLKDGLFLWQQDQKLPLAEHVKRLHTITYHEELGTLYQKQERIVALVGLLQETTRWGNLQEALRAAALCKGDLATELVGEFPELQGKIGYHLALVSGESPVVAHAIDEQWWPRGEGAPLPESPEGTLLSLADKWETLISSFAIGLEPTASRDPYGLRRQVLAICRILIHHQLRLPLSPFLERAYQLFCKATGRTSEPEVISRLERFFRNRIQTVLSDFGFRPEEINAALAVGYPDITDAFLRVQALHHFRQEETAYAPLLKVYKRVRGFLVGEEAEELSPHHAEEITEEEAERSLREAYKATQGRYTQAVASGDYQSAYGEIASLQPHLDHFINSLRILDPNPLLRARRVSLIRKIFDLIAQLLDLQALPH